MTIGRLVAALSVCSLVALVAASGGFAAGERRTVVLPTYVARLVTTHSNASKPSQIVFGADGRTRLLSLRWAAWGKPKAHAAGTDEVDVGAAGSPQLIDAPATVVASRIRRCDGVLTYTRLDISSPASNVPHRAVRPHRRLAGAASPGLPFVPAGQGRSTGWSAYTPPALAPAALPRQLERVSASRSLRGAGRGSAGTTATLRSGAGAGPRGCGSRSSTGQLDPDSSYWRMSSRKGEALCRSRRRGSRLPGSTGLTEVAPIDVGGRLRSNDPRAREPHCVTPHAAAEGDLQEGTGRRSTLWSTRSTLLLPGGSKAGITTASVNRSPTPGGRSAALVRSSFVSRILKLRPDRVIYSRSWISVFQEAKLPYIVTGTGPQLLARLCRRAASRRCTTSRSTGR